MAAKTPGKVRSHSTSGGYEKLIREGCETARDSSSTGTRFSLLAQVTEVELPGIEVQLLLFHWGASWVVWKGSVVISIMTPAPFCIHDPIQMPVSRYYLDLKSSPGENFCRSCFSNGNNVEGAETIAGISRYESFG